MNSKPTSVSAGVLLTVLIASLLPLLQSRDAGRFYLRLPPAVAGLGSLEPWGADAPRPGRGLYLGPEVSIPVQALEQRRELFGSERMGLEREFGMLMRRAGIFVSGLGMPVERERLGRQAREIGEFGAEYGRADSF